MIKNMNNYNQSLILTSEQMRNADLNAITALGIKSTELMKSAAFALYDTCIEMYEQEKYGDEIIIICGKGNNAGDGFALCEILSQRGYRVHAIAVFGVSDLSADANEMFKKNNKTLIINYTDSELKILALNKIAHSRLVVDCLFGTGFSGIIDSECQKIIQAANKKTVLSCDLPSGVECETGKVSNACIKAKKTVTFAAYKPCHFLFPAKNYCGQIILADIGITNKILIEQNPYIELINEETVQSILKIRSQNSHKGTFGTLQICAGSPNMTGAAALAAKSALRSGVGLVKIALDSKTKPILQQKIDEAVFLDINEISQANAYLCGCGLGENAQITEKYLRLNYPCVFDADSLSYIAKNPNVLELCSTRSFIFTPHPLEMSRLCGQTIEQIESDRIGTARNFALKYNVTLVLKGHHTLVATPDGYVFINTTGNSGLAKGGSGDVLAGLIAGLLAQGYSTVESALIGVYFHGKAAEKLSEQYSESGILPSDLPLEIAKYLP